MGPGQGQDKKSRREADSWELIFTLQSVPKTGPGSEFLGRGGVWGLGEGRVEETYLLSQGSKQCILGGPADFGPRGCREVCSRRLGSGVGDCHTLAEAPDFALSKSLWQQGALAALEQSGMKYCKSQVHWTQSLRPTESQFSHQRNGRDNPDPTELP